MRRSARGFCPRGPSDFLCGRASGAVHLRRVFPLAVIFWAIELIQSRRLAAEHDFGYVSMHVAKDENPPVTIPFKTRR